MKPTSWELTLQEVASKIVNGEEDITILRRYNTTHREIVLKYIEIMLLQNNVFGLETKEYLENLGFQVKVK